MNTQKALPLEAIPDSALPVSAVSSAELFAKQRRLDGATYLAAGHLIRRRLQQAPAIVVRLAELADVRMPGRLKGIVVSPSCGVGLLTASQAFQIRPSVRKWLLPGAIPDLQHRFVKNGTIMVTRSGTVGQTIIAHAPHSGHLISEHLMRLYPLSAADGGFLYAFLRSRYGQALIAASTYGSVVNQIEPSHLGAVPVPLPPHALRDELQTRVDRVYELRDEAFALAREAEDTYAQMVGAVDAGADGEEDGFSATASALTHGRRRLDAFHHNPTAATVLLRALAKAGHLQCLSDVTSGVFWKQRFARAYTGKGIPYLHADNLFSVNPQLPKSVAPNCVEDVNSYSVARGWLLMACSGQIYGLNGSAILTTPWHEGKFVSHDVIRIIPSGIRAGYLLTALTHPQLGRPLVLRWAFGTQIPHIEPDDILNVPILRLGQRMENEIADRAERAAELRYRADCEENAAVKLVEEALAALVGPVPDTDTQS